MISGYRTTILKVQTQKHPRSICDAKLRLTHYDSDSKMQIEATSSPVKNKFVSVAKIRTRKIEEQEQGIAQPGNTPVAKRRRLTRRDWTSKLQGEVARSVKKEHVDGVKVKEERNDEQKAADGDPWWQVRCRLEEMIRGSNLGTALEEKLLLANVTQQVQQLIQQEKLRAVDEQKAEKAVKADAVQPKPTRIYRKNLVKQSRVLHVSWNKTMVGWTVRFPRLDSKGEKNGWTNRLFALKKFLVPGRSEPEADAAALDAAKAFRAELVQQGLLSEPKPSDPNFTSEVPGVLWAKRHQKWLVQINQKNCKERIFGGYFREKAAAEAKCLDLREQHGLQRQVKPVSTLAELPVFSPKVPYPGVSWDQKWQKWRAQCQVGGTNRQFCKAPKDHSEEELERSFKTAVAWRKKQEKEKRKAAKPKAPPVKKRPMFRK